MARVLPFVLLLLTTAVVSADTLSSARTARALLGPDLWSRVLSIENTHGTARYPAQLYALVFELEGRLWIYTGLDGTQSLSLYANRLERDKADLGPLLREVSPALARFEDVTDALPSRLVSRVKETEDLPNGCFVKCVARWRALLAEKSLPDEAGLLAYYIDTVAGRLGHTVLVYRQDGRRYVYDPEGEGTVFFVPEWLPGDPLRLARAVYPLSHRQALADARLLALNSPIAVRKSTIIASRPDEKPAVETAETPIGSMLY